MVDRDLLTHKPVMLESVMGYLRCRANARYVDGTLGGGGYAEAILNASSPSGQLLGLDWDDNALERAAKRLRQYAGRFHVRRAPFSSMRHELENLGWDGVDGIVLDLGVSSLQLDDPSRGFSFMHDGPLDMRMDLRLSITAADLVNTLPANDLETIIRDLGEERWARRIVRAIVQRRRIEPFTRTRDLAKVIEEAVPKTADSRRLHPATRTFMALRMKVNRELEVLDDFLRNALPLLNSGGRLCVVSFHSREDRLVKRAFQSWAKNCRCSPRLLRCECEGRPLVLLLTRRVIRPAADELQRNPRARSARLRVIEKI